MIIKPITKPALSMLKPGRSGMNHCSTGVTMVSAK